MLNTIDKLPYIEIDKIGDRAKEAMLFKRRNFSRNIDGIYKNTITTITSRIKDAQSSKI